MNKNIMIAIFLLTGFVYSQEKILNDDGTIADDFKREMLVAAFNDYDKLGIKYDLEDLNMVIITKNDCGDEIYKSEEIQNLAMKVSFAQLHEQISRLKQNGLDIFKEHAIEGIIFKTNTICMHRTRRYHFKFTVFEIESLPEYLDMQELIEYVIIEKENKNIIHIKNDF